MLTENADESVLPAPVAVVECVARNLLQVGVGQRQGASRSIDVALEPDQETLVSPSALGSRVLAKQDLHFSCIQCNL